MSKLIAAARGDCADPAVAGYSLSASLPLLMLPGFPGSEYNGSLIRKVMCYLPNKVP